MASTDPFQVRVPFSYPQGVADTSAIVWPATDPDGGAVILAHGAGTDMTHRHMRRHAGDLAAAGHAVALFNFAYTEMGRKRPDPQARLESAWRDVIAALRPHLGADRPLVIGGRSMGGRIASMVAAAPDHPEVAGVACIAYPLHPAGRPEKLRVAHWPALTMPILLVNGTRDAMAPADSLSSCVEQHMPAGLAMLHLVEGADHSFRVRKRDDRTEDDALSEVATTVDAWVRTLTDRGSA